MLITQLIKKARYPLALHLSFAVSFVFAQKEIDVNTVVISNKIDLIKLAAKDTAGKTIAQIKIENLENLKKLTDVDVTKLSNFRPNDVDKPVFLKLKDATNTLIAAKQNPVVSLDKYPIYDPKGLGIGFCFGRAMFVHLDLESLGLNRTSIQKAYVVGKMEVKEDKTKWDWHVTTIAQSKNSSGNKIWVALDPIDSKIIEVKEWYEKMLKDYSIDKKLKLYITHPTRLGTFGEGYSADDMKDPFYNNYFNDMGKWMEDEKDKGINGRYGKKLTR